MSEDNRGIEVLGKDGNLVMVIGLESTITLGDLAVQLANHLQATEMLGFVKAVVQAGKADEFRTIIDALEIAFTESAFKDDNKRGVILSTVMDYPFKWWVQWQGKFPADMTRCDIMSYWDFLLKLFSDRGLVSGSINQVGQTTDLWKATATLAAKMTKSTEKYCCLPPILINNPEQVAKKLAEIADPKAFLEVLTGEAWSDMLTAPEFLGAFSLIEDRNDAEGCVATVMLLMQKG